MVQMQKAGEARVPRNKFFALFPGIRTIVGLTTVIMISMSAYQCFYLRHMFHKAIFYATIVIPIFLLEEKRIVLFCFGLDGFLCRLLRPVLGVPGLVRAMMYGMLSTVILTKSMLGRASLCVPTGALLAVLAVLYLIKPLETKKTNVYIKQEGKGTTIAG